MNCYRK